MIPGTCLFPFFLDHKPQPKRKGLVFHKLTFVFCLARKGVSGNGDSKGEGADTAAMNFCGQVIL